MKQSLNKQSGLTFLGLVFILGMIALVTIFVLRLFPLYNEKFQIDAAMETVVSQPEAAAKNITETRRAFLRALAVTNIRRFNDDNMKDYVNIIKPKERGAPPLLHVQYQATNKLFADIQLLLTYDRQIPMDGSGSEGD